MPYVSQGGLTLESKVVLGGIERFQQLVYENFPNIIVPVRIPKDIRISRDAGKKLSEALEEHQPTMIFSNAPTTSLSINLAKKVTHYGVKMVHVHHEPLERTMMIMGVCKNLIKMRDLGVEIYMVSQNQYEFYDFHCKRLTGNYLGYINGLVNPAYADSSAKPSKNVKYDVSTIGRNIPSKDPFWVHRKLEKSELVTAVMTSPKGITYKSKAANKYIKKNERWDDPLHLRRYTFRGESHQENMEHVSKSYSFVSTWPLESWGITALEALSHGIPTILLTEKDGKHASEAIAADPTHIKKVTKSTTKKDLEKVINGFKDLSHSDRVKISEDTKKKHNKEDWIKDIETKIIGVAQHGKSYPFSSEK